MGEKSGAYGELTRTLIISTIVTLVIIIILELFTPSARGSDCKNTINGNELTTGVIIKESLKITYNIIYSIGGFFKKTHKVYNKEFGIRIDKYPTILIDIDPYLYKKNNKMRWC
jgi:hypothetical protein